MLYAVATFFLVAGATAYPAAAVSEAAFGDAEQRTSDRNSTGQDGVAPYSNEDIAMLLLRLPAHAAPKNGTLSSTSPNEVEWAVGCKVLGSYTPTLYKGQSQYPACGVSPFEPIIPCKGADDIGPCVEWRHDGSETVVKNDKIDTMEQAKDFMDVTAQVSGKGFGVSASASVQFLTQSTTNSNSMRFTAYTGRSKLATAAIRNPRSLKLTDYAAKMLKDDRVEFFTRYGMFFVSSEYMGASFTGMLSFTDESSFNKVDTKVSASLTYAWVSAQASLDTVTEKMSKSTHVMTQAIATGGVQPGTDLSLKTMLEQQRAWYDEIERKCVDSKDPRKECNAETQTILVSSYTDVEAVAKIIREAGEDPEHYNKAMLPQEQLQRLLREYVSCKLLKNSVDGYTHAARRFVRQGVTDALQLTSRLEALNQKVTKQYDALLSLKFSDAADFDTFACSTSPEFSNELDLALQSTGLPNTGPLPECDRQCVAQVGNKCDQFTYQCVINDGGLACDNRHTRNNNEASYPCTITHEPDGPQVCFWDEYSHDSRIACYVPMGRCPSPMAGDGHFWEVAKNGMDDCKWHSHNGFQSCEQRGITPGNC